MRQATADSCSRSNLEADVLILNFCFIITAWKPDNLNYVLL